MKLITYIYLSALLLFTACTNKSGTADTGDKKLKVVTTTGMIADAVRFIGGSNIEVTALMGPGVDPHLYKATQGDLSLLTNADIIFYNGLHLEGKMGEVFEKLSRTKTVVAVSDEIPHERLHRVPQFNDSYDPHIWFDLSLWKLTLPVVEKTLLERLPDKSEEIKNATLTYTQKLDSLHEWAVKQIAEIPASSRILITAHDAFGYFGKAYGMEVKGLQGISTISEFGLRDRVELVDLIVGRQIKAVFVETSVPVRSINAVVEGCKEKGFEVKIGGYLYSDAMGEQGTPEGTFEGMFKANVTTITESLK